MKKQPITKPVIIDYPADRRLLQQEFGKIAATPGFAESVERSREVIHGKPKVTKRINWEVFFMDTSSSDALAEFAKGSSLDNLRKDCWSQDCKIECSRMQKNGVKKSRIGARRAITRRGCN